MIEEKQALVVTFETLTDAFKARECCQENGIDVELIAVPGKVTAGCGTAMKADESEKDRIPELLKSHNVPFDQAIITTVEA